MSVRRTVAPDMVGCCFLLYAGTLFFAVLRAPYVHREVATVVRDLAIFGGLFCLCTLIAVGLFQRRSLSWLPAMLLSLAAIVAGAMAFHIPDTAQLPAGVLGATGIVLLWARRGEFAQDGAPGSAASADSDSPAASPATEAD